MAELALGFFSAMAGTGAAAGAVGVTSTVATVLSGVATAGSILMQLQSGQVQQQEANWNAQIATYDGEQQVLESQRRELEIRREVLQKVGAARVAFAGSGLDVSSGQLSAIEGDINTQGDYETGIEKANQRRARAEAAIKSSQLGTRGENARLAATGGAFVTGARGLLDIVKRG